MPGFDVGFRKEPATTSPLPESAFPKRTPLAKRFYQIAFELGVRPRSFIRELSEFGLSVGNQMVVVHDELETRIRDMHERMHAAPEPEPVVEPVEAAAEATDVYVEEGEAVAEQAPEPVGATMEADTAEVDTAEVAEDVAEQPADPQAETPEEQSRGRRIEDQHRPKEGSLLPTLDPRAGRLVKEAPKGGIPGARPPTSGRRPTGRGGYDPVLPTQGRAPGYRKDSGRRTPQNRFQGKRGKETFQIRNRGRYRKSRPAVPKVRPTSIDVELPITVKQFGELSSYKAAEIIKVLFTGHKMILNPNSPLDKDTVELLALELDIDVNFKTKETAEDELLKAFEKDPEDAELSRRPPIVTILGHVDHGKTTLLDYIRSTDVAGKEAGGITQSIGASQVELEDGRKVTFIDTPGHEAFTEMRARGAQVTDVVVLIVAADDGVMPQTVEAISHAKAAGVTIVVAVTKIDREGVNVERAKQQLTEHEVYVEGYGGDVALFPVSGITGEGVKELLEHIALLAEVEAEKFRANPHRAALGTVIEAEASSKRGVVATVLVENGTLRKGDPVLVGDAWGSVRAMSNDKGWRIKSAVPGDPVEITGLDRAPQAGAKLYVTEDTATAKKIAEDRRQRARELEVAAQTKPATLESLFEDIEATRVEEVKLVVKADVQGSLAPLKTVLDRMSMDEVKVRVIHAAVGAVNESDVVLASAASTGAWIIAFNVNVDAKARERAKKEHVDIRSYKVIYDIEADVRDAMEGRLAPEMEEKVLGHAEILQIFTFSKIGNIAGCRVKDGIMRRDARVRVFRGEEQVFEGQLSSLRREKDEAKEVKEGFECGMTIKDFDDFQQGDMIEAYVIEAKKRTLTKS